MSSLKKEGPWQTAGATRPVSEAALRLAAGVLLVASDALARVAAALTPAAAASIPAQEACAARFEFHGEAGAPEGALYVDGELVGRLPGVRRL
ncbi:MAG TPA: hypothetical protein VGO85_15635 [Caldimonas sp.]|jgi:hypothetical protein|nr:hypothetical protein [Caldimonas sp.]